MSNTLKEDIYNALNELMEKQFKEFKWRLNTINYDGRPNIPMASLDKADLQQEVVELLIQYYGEDALEVCIDVLRKCNRNDLAKNLEENKDVDAHQLPILSEYRNYIKQKFAMIKDPNAIPGEYMPLNQRYSELILLDYHQSEEEKEDEILAMGRKHLEIINKRAETSTSIETLFNPDKYGLTPQVVVLQGAAGIGKTMMAKKIMFDWASQQLYQNKFNYVFYISCSEMNFHAEFQKTSIAEIISNEWLKCQKVKNVIQNILKNEEKLLFIIDGFDELRHSFNQTENYCCTDPWKKEPVRILFSNLFQKKILPKSSLIITTRPTALEKLNQCLEHPHYFEVLGFSTKEREEYFYKFFENKDQAMQALRFVKQNDTIFTMCVIPLVSWIICTVMKQELERGKDLQKTPYTLTAIYMLYFSSLLKFHHKESKQDVQANVKGLCSLAAEGVWKRKILFMEKDVKKHGLDQRDYLPLFLNQNVFKRDIDCIQTYSFIHLSFQEFFAALFYVLEVGQEHHSENWNTNLQTLLKCHKSFRSDFAVGFRFLFGLLNEEKRMRQLKKEFGWEISPKNKEFLLDWVKFKIDKRKKETFAYLYETQDDNFVNDALYGVTKINFRCNSDMELIFLAYCIQHCQNLKEFYIEIPTFPYREEEKIFFSKIEEWNLDERYMEDFFKALTKLRNLRDLRLDGWSFTESCSRHLAEVFKKNQRLKMLRLAPTDIDDRAAELLCEGLQHMDCKIETLVLARKAINESCSRHFAEVLSKMQSLRALGLSLKNVDDKSMELLCRGLKHPECKIEILQLGGEILTETCSRNLAEVLRKNQRLTELYLLLNNTNDKIMELLCDGLSHPECKIETIQLDGKTLTESCSRHLAEVLRKNQKLSVLYLFLKNPDDKIMELLCNGLKHPECTIQSLQLDGKFLTESSSKYLALLFRKNQRLRTIHMIFNSTDDKTMELLCDGLSHPECKIETIELAGEVLNESCSRHLAEVLRKNQRLKKLILSLKNRDDKIMEVLCDGLKQPECTIETLNLTEGFITKSGSRHLAEVIRKKQRLKRLNLYLDNENNEAVEVLCEGIKHPECTVNTLQLAGEIMTESCSRHLAEVLTKNQRLRELYLLLNVTNDKIMELMYDGLSHPECKIETIRLAGEIQTESCSRHLAEVLRKNQRLRKIYLFLNNTDDKRMELMCDGLNHPECKIELDGETLTESCSRHLAELLRKNQKLCVLYLFLKNPDDKIMELLCNGLKHPECTIQTLEISFQSLTESCCRHFAEVFRKNHSLRVLYLFFEDANDRKMELLCDGLKHPECTIKMLQLDGEITKESTMRPLTEVFRENQTLEELSLSLKNSDEGTMKILCEGLKHPQCTIEILELGEEMAKESTMRHLTEVFKENQSLRYLRLSFKNPDESAMEILCKGLKHPQSTIETLELDKQITKESTMRLLTEVFRENQTLINLSLSLKNPDGRAMEVLCEGLKHPQCTLHKLHLGGDMAKESIMKLLTQVFRENQRLTQLRLSFKNPDKGAMEILYEGLKHPQCTIQLLELNGEIGKESIMRPLTEVFMENQTLKNLRLSLQNPDERAMEVLCEGLNHPQCTIEIIDFGGEIAKESTVRPLTEVFRKNQRLRNLCLSFSNADERTMNILCEGLKDPQCTIETLCLGREIAKESTMRPLTVVFRGNQRLRTLFLCLKNPDERAMEILCEGLKHPQCSLEMLWVCEDVAKESTMRFLTKVFMENQRLRNLSLFLKNLQQGAMKILFEGLKHPQCTIQMLQLNGICIIQNGKWN
ncbi:NACHT, LRR and PYD domains-containing protein 12-like [Erythrolamprus reginae]|uniref:NACHT, LRR and PYD domains-containing protein 12-like n=1 Tax=Erythrolamprus reginae TaxID=121349 RepID=UPI00396CCF3A